MTDRIAGSSPQAYARTCGWLYLAVFVAGFFALSLAKAIVPGDVAATARNIASSESLWRLGFASDILTVVCYAAITLILYVLLRPVDRNLALLAALFSMVGNAVGAVTALTHFAALLLVLRPEYLTMFDAHQLDGLAFFCLKLYRYGNDVALVFFGFYCLLLGYLIFRSGYFPKALGVLLVVAFPCYLINSFTDVLFPALAFPLIVLPAFVAELALCLWLIVKGVDVRRWDARGAAT